MNFTKEERQWIISAVDNFKMKIKADRHDDQAEMEYLKNVKTIVETASEVNTQTIEFITKALRLYLKQYDTKIEDNIPSIIIVESILNKAESFLIKPIQR